MELDKVIKERRSVRKFKDLDVPWQFVAECLDAARYAPTSGNIQNFRFIVVKDKNKISNIADSCEDSNWLVQAPVIIVVCAELSKIRRMFSVRGEALYAVQNCACAIQNLLLKAYELGLGTCWIGAFDEKKLGEILEITGDSRPQAVIALGYGKENPELTRDPLDVFVYFEKYGNKTDQTRSFSNISNFLKSGLEKVIRYKTKK